MRVEKVFAIMFAVPALWLVPGLRAQGKPAQQPKPAVPAPSAAGEHPAGAPGRAKSEPGPSKRDPFTPLINERKDSSAISHLPPGKAGLVIATTHVDGAVRSKDGMIAVVSNPEQRVYFVREGDRLYDGAVEKIGLDGVTFRESSKDAFGKPVERMVTKRIYASAGEQQ